MSEGTNRNMPARKTLVQLLALCTDPESQNAQRYGLSTLETIVGDNLSPKTANVAEFGDCRRFWQQSPNWATIVASVDRPLQTDGRTDRRHDDANSRSHSVAVRSAKNQS